MKKTLKRMFAFLFAFAMMFTTLALPTRAAEEGYLMYVGFGANNDWAYQYNSPNADNNAGDVVATTAYTKPGDTVTIGFTLPAATDYTWWMAPVLVAENVSNVDYTINSIKIDGNDVLADVDLTAGDAWWYEGTGAYTNEQSIRLAGGYNEWGTKYMATSPANFTTVEYSITLNAVEHKAASAGATVELDGPFDMFLGYGGGSDWSLCYNSPISEDNNAEIVATTAQAKPGDTVTIGVTLPTASDYTWWMAPVLVTGDNADITNVDYTINSIKIDGVDVLPNVDLTAGDAWWYEGTGAYTSEQSIRLAGGYNEWGTKYMAAGPANFTTIEYSITLNKVEAGGSAATLSTEEFPAFIAYGGNNDWGMQYYGENNAGNSGDITAVNGVLKNGETTVLSLEFGTAPDYTWFVAPCMVVENTAAIAAETSFDVKVFVDGVEVATDLTLGDNFWAEATGDYAQCIRIAGGYNEWGTQYMACPANFNKIEFHITPTIYTQEVVVEEAKQFDFDPNGTYHAYLGVQTPTWIFRNAWDDATYGKESGCFDQLGIADGAAWQGLGGTFTDVEITGNGTYTVKLEGFDFSGTYLDQAILGADGVFNLLFLSTDLPMNDACVLSNITLKMDGKELATQETPFFNGDKEAIQEVLFANIWNNEIEQLPYYAAPKESIEITFTVSGFANDVAVEAPAEDAPVESEPVAEPSVDTPADVDTTAPAEEGGNATTIIIVVVVVVVVAAAVAAGVIVSKKKKAK